MTIREDTYSQLLIKKQETEFIFLITLLTEKRVIQEAVKYGFTSSLLTDDVAKKIYKSFVDGAVSPSLLRVKDKTLYNQYVNKCSELGYDPLEYALAPIRFTVESLIRYSKTIDVFQDIHSVNNKLTETNVDDCITELYTKLIKIQISRKNKDSNIKTIVNKAFDARAERSEGDLAGYSTGITALDTALGGLQKGQLITVAAQTSFGKSLLAVHMMCEALKDNAHCIYYSLEMSQEQYWRR